MKKTMLAAVAVAGIAAASLAGCASGGAEGGQNTAAPVAAETVAPENGTVTMGCAIAEEGASSVADVQGFPVATTVEVARDGADFIYAVDGVDWTEVANDDGFWIEVHRLSAGDHESSEKTRAMVKFQVANGYIEDPRLTVAGFDGTDLAVSEVEVGADSATFRAVGAAQAFEAEHGPGGTGVNLLWGNAVLGDIECMTGLVGPADVSSAFVQEGDFRCYTTGAGQAVEPVEGTLGGYVWNSDGTVTVSRTDADLLRERGAAAWGPGNDEKIAPGESIVVTGTGAQPGMVWEVGLEADDVTCSSVFIENPLLTP